MKSLTSTGATVACTSRSTLYWRIVIIYNFQRKKGTKGAIELARLQVASL